MSHSAHAASRKRWWRRIGKKANGGKHAHLAICEKSSTKAEQKSISRKNDKTAKKSSK